MLTVHYQRVRFTIARSIALFTNTLRIIGLLFRSLRRCFPFLRLLRPGGRYEKKTPGDSAFFLLLFSCSLVLVFNVSLEQSFDISDQHGVARDGEEVSVTFQDFA